MAPSASWRRTTRTTRPCFRRCPIWTISPRRIPTPGGSGRTASTAVPDTADAPGSAILPRERHAALGVEVQVHLLAAARAKEGIGADAEGRFPHRGRTVVELAHERDDLHGGHQDVVLLLERGRLAKKADGYE